MKSIGTRVVLAGVLVLVLSACGVRYMYSQLDWLVPWYVRDYVTLDAEQRALLDVRLAERLDWHCECQLPGYSAWLRGVAANVGEMRLDRIQLEQQAVQAEAFVRALMEALADDVPVLLAALSDAQVVELFGNLEDLNRKVRAEHIDAPAAALSVRQGERMERRLRRWFGRLNADQRELVRIWRTQLTPVTEEWFANRMDWQRRLQEALSQRHDRPVFERLLAELLIHPDAAWSARYRAGVMRNRALTLALLADIHALATPRQRDRLLHEIDTLARQFDRLACNDRAGEVRRQAQTVFR